MRYMVDTNIFSRLISGQLQLDALPHDGEFWATPVQSGELNDTRDEETRRGLQSKFRELVGSKSVRAAFAFDVRGAGLDEGEWRDDASIYDTLKANLDAEWKRLPCKKRTRRKKENNAKDALIAEAALRHNLTLLTADLDLARVAKKHGIQVCCLLCMNFRASQDRQNFRG